MSADAVALLVSWAGARVQRVDRITERSLVLELRVPGNTFRLWVSAEGPVSVGMVPERPAKEVDGGDLQRFLRKRLPGQVLCGVRTEGSALCLEWVDHDLWIQTKLPWVRLEAVKPSRAAPAPPDPERLPSLPSSPPADPEPLKRPIRRSMQSEAKRLQRLRKKVEADARRLAQMSEAESWGELLKGALHRVERGQSFVTVQDWSQDGSVTVPLDPALSPAENLNKLFQRAKKGRRGLPMAQERLERIEQAWAELEADRAALEAFAGSEAELRERFAPWLSSSAASAAPSSRSPKGNSNSGPRDARRFEAKDGSVVWVGKNARANDRLTASAKGGDLWLHARGVVGAHVVVMQRSGHVATEQDILDAAHLALHFSEAHREAKAEVSVTEARYVKKTKGAPPGQVGISKAKTLLVSVEPERLDRLLGRTGHRGIRGHS